MRFQIFATFEIIKIRGIQELITSSLNNDVFLTHLKLFKYFNIFMFIVTFLFTACLITFIKISNKLFKC
jgi:hypothetical protein